MALSKDYEFRGVKIPNAIFKFYQFRGYQNKVYFFVSVHANREAPYIDILDREYEMQVTMGSKDIAAQAYDFLKTQPEFANAVDVLEDGQFAEPVSAVQPDALSDRTETDDGSEYLSRV